MSKEPQSLGEMIDLFNSYRPKSGQALIEQVKGFAKTLEDFSSDERFTTAEKFTLAAIGGIVDSTIHRLEREQAKPAAANQPDNLTSYDI